MEFPKVLQLNVGGRHFTTSLSTLTKYPDSMLATMFSGRHNVDKDGDGRFFIDADGDVFVHILKFLRFKKPPPPEEALEVLEYAEYFGISELKTVLSDCMPVIAVPLYKSVREKTLNYADTLKQTLRKLSNDHIVSLSVLLVVNNGRICQPDVYEYVYYNIPNIDHNFSKSEFKDYNHIEVSTGGSAVGVSAVAAALVYDLKAYGIYPDDEVIYRPSPSCQCTVGRKLRLTV